MKVDTHLPLTNSLRTSLDTFVDGPVRALAGLSDGPCLLLEQPIEREIVAD